MKRDKMKGWRDDQWVKVLPLKPGRGHWIPGSTSWKETTKSQSCHHRSSTVPHRHPSLTPDHDTQIRKSKKNKTDGQNAEIKGMQ